jgi:hypothetical protein
LSDDAGAETSGGSRRNPAIEDEPDLFWSAEVEVLTDDGFEEEAAVLGLVEDLAGTFGGADEPDESRLRVGARSVRDGASDSCRAVSQGGA